MRAGMQADIGPPPPLPLLVSGGQHWASGPLPQQGSQTSFKWPWPQTDNTQHGVQHHIPPRHSTPRHKNAQHHRQPLACGPHTGTHLHITSPYANAAGQGRARRLLVPPSAMAAAIIALLPRLSTPSHPHIPRRSDSQLSASQPLSTLAPLTPLSEAQPASTSTASRSLGTPQLAAMTDMHTGHIQQLWRELDSRAL